MLSFSGERRARWQHARRPFRAHLHYLLTRSAYSSDLSLIATPLLTSASLPIIRLGRPLWLLIHETTWTRLLDEAGDSSPVHRERAPADSLTSGRSQKISVTLHTTGSLFRLHAFSGSQLSGQAAHTDHENWNNESTRGEAVLWSIT